MVASCSAVKLTCAMQIPNFDLYDVSFWDDLDYIGVDFYRPVGCHYRISPRFPAIGCEALQKGFETLESPLVTGFYAAF